MNESRTLDTTTAPKIQRRKMLRDGAMAFVTGAAAAVLAIEALPDAEADAQVQSAERISGADAELIRVCFRFAETELANWYWYVTTPDADEQYRGPDWTSLHWITATPATTPEGWHAKALAYSAWYHEAYDDHESDRDAQSPLLAALLRDMVAPARNAIIARLAALYGPLPDTYTPDGIWIGEGASS